MIGDPRDAPPRADLTFLRRRVRPAAAPAAPAATARTAPAARAATPSSSGGHIDYSRHSTAKPPAAASAPAPSAPAPSPVRSAARGASPLDLSAPAAPAAPAASAAARPASGPAQHVDYHRRDGGGAASGSLDLSAPSAPPAPPAGGSSAGVLDLSAAPTPARVAARPAAEPTDPRHRVRRDVRITGRASRLMSVKDPTVTLTRVQSGIGQLSVEAVCSPSVGDLRLGAVYQLRSGGSGVVQHADGNRFGPSSRRPVLTASREEYERIGLDLRQVHDIERIGVFAYSESRAQLSWGGTLVVELYGGGRLELPLETLYPGRIAMLMSIYDMDGELVVRAEMETISGDVREAARAYGYDRITWRDERTPVD